MPLALGGAAIVAAIVIIAVVAPMTRHAGGGPDAAPAPGSASASDARTAARAFLSSWVDGDGRVVRRDQGGDTVSEGQGYGMLLAAGAQDHAQFDRIWGWTRTHLQHPDGSFAWQWRDGNVVDQQPASDADLDITHALQVAATQWHERAYSTAADRIAATTLRTSTVATREGRLLVAGPWAVGSASTPAVLDPSYLVAGEARQLAHNTGQAGWTQVADATSTMDATLLHDGQLPPDWAQLPVGARSATQVRAAAAPNTGEGIAYSLDAPRLLIRLATSCAPDDRKLAAATSAAATVGAPAVRNLSGSGEVDWTHPITDVAADAVLTAQHRSAQAGAALASAAREQQRTPTYYGAAWTALGALQLTDAMTGSCAQEAAS